MADDRPQPLVDEDGRITSDLACPRCEHNLRGRTLRDKCGECGYDVRYAIRFQRYRAVWTPTQKVAMWVGPPLAIAMLAVNVRHFWMTNFMGVYRWAALFTCLWLVMAAAAAVVLARILWSGRFRLVSVLVLMALAMGSLLMTAMNWFAWAIQ